MRSELGLDLRERLTDTSRNRITAVSFGRERARVGSTKVLGVTPCGGQLLGPCAKIGTGSRPTLERLCKRRMKHGQVLAAQQARYIVFEFTRLRRRFPQFAGRG